MRGFDFFRDHSLRYIPKTSNAALRGVIAGFVPIEAYVFMATSIKPLNEEPLDLDAIEQTLGRETLDIKTNLLLARTLETLLHSPEQETALFAAESINLIENRYGKRIEKLKAQVEMKPDPTAMDELSLLCRDLAQLYAPGTSLRAFHLHESYTWLIALKRTAKMGEVANSRLIRVLVELGLYDQARTELERFGIGHNTAAYLLEAEIEFERRNFPRVFEICRELSLRPQTLSDAERQCVTYWLEQNE
ncbi:MAG TPA: hypothetical protein VMW87_06680 [Spirochaetia bacterium]|nr:hypothetical protein [Spirochaetia bacterium]